ncbi:hypothetical protein N7520_009918 [Penicillium odoratum]|uniref:uncharacterized protein n=1 Tax=Penicillium odoratum TaxID=1167516 RepID=UPI0025490735|nr:uncharacterized protein N7520_009918 [Penicillium odoratum]KAJ5753001.1 hypothetical protein N7520_009918 [Penicillium odoratum]
MIESTAFNFKLPISKSAAFKFQRSLPWSLRSIALINKRFAQTLKLPSGFNEHHFDRNTVCLTFVNLEPVTL